jgi:hypothetical protein
LATSDEVSFGFVRAYLFPAAAGAHANIEASRFRFHPKPDAILLCHFPRTLKIFEHCGEMHICLANFLARDYNTHMAHGNPVTNEALLEIMQDLMQITSDGFARLENRVGRVEGRVGGVEEHVSGVEDRLGRFEGELKELRNASYRHEVELGKQTRLIESAREETNNVHIDINEILHRIMALEQKASLDKVERAEAQQRLQRLVDWAKLAANQIGVPLKLT